ncbi:MAG: ATP-binding protein [Bacteroidales bacterium]
MERLRLKSNYLISRVPLGFTRSIASQINWNDRLIGILGARGLGKTTLLLQQISKNHGVNSHALYISMDDLAFAGASLHRFATEFSNKGGTLLYIDEVHKYPQWSQELKIIYDTLPDLKVVFAGASTIDILKHYANLSKRATIHNLYGLSFREYLEMYDIANLPAVTLDTLLDDHQAIALEMTKEFKPAYHFDKYLTMGYYLFDCSDYEAFKRELESSICQTIESDMAYMEGYDSRNAHKIKKLLNAIAQSVPFKPNLVKISETIGVHRNTLINYFFHLEKASLIQMLYPSGSAISILQKPEMVYLNNPNSAQLLPSVSPDRDALILTFAANVLGSMGQVKITSRGFFDFEGKWLFALEGPKGAKRRKPRSKEVFTLTDGIEVGSDKSIPLWLLGLATNH